MEGNYNFNSPEWSDISDDPKDLVSSNHAFIFLQTISPDSALSAIKFANPLSRLKGY